MAKKNNKKGGLNGLPSDKGKDKDKPKGTPGQGFGGGTGGSAKPANWKGGGKDKPTGPKGVKGDDPAHKDPGKPKGKPTTKGGKFEDGKKKGSDDGGGGGGDINERMFNFQKKEAERARQEEKDRKERIQKGMKKINKSFAGFDKAYYDKREADFKAHYMGQLNPQFDKARDNLTYALARAGLGTTVGTAGSTAEVTANKLNEADISRQIAQVGADAASDRTKTQAQIAAERSALVQTLNANAQANQIGNEATAKVNQLASAVPDYNPVPDIFFGTAQGVGGLVQAAQNAQYSNIFNNGGSGSGVNRGGTTIR